MHHETSDFDTPREVGRTERSRRPSGLRAALTVVILVLGVVITSAAPSAAQEQASGDPRVIGGEVAPPGTWRSQAAILSAEIRDPFQAQLCGGTVIDPSWVLTAAHCVTGEDGRPVSPDLVDVLVGTQDLRHGGRRLSVAEIRVRPGYDAFRLIHDMALLRLADPAPVPRDLEVAGPGDIPPSGTELTFAGWGQSDAPGQYRPDRLRQGASPVLSASECEAALTEAAAEFDAPGYHSSHTCTGDIGIGGRGPCYGDSGGPLVWETGGRQVLVGVVSWGIYCGSPETPSVFARVSSASGWIGATIRYGPHRSAAELGEVFSFLAWTGPPSTVVDDPAVAMEAILRERSVEDREAAIVRLYRSVLDRPADKWGFDYWRQRVGFGGASLTRVADLMTRSVEFRATYGALDDAAFVARIYQNVLGRPGDGAGTAHWLDALSRGMSRGGVVARFSQSAEHRTRTRGGVDVQVAFLVAFGRAATPSELAALSTRPTSEVLTFLLHSLGYAQTARFGGAMVF